MGLLWGGGSLSAALALVLFAACAGTDTPPHADIEDNLEIAYGNGAGKAGSASMSAAGAAGSAGSAGTAGAAAGVGGSGGGAAGSGSVVGNAGSASVGNAGSAAMGNAGTGSGGTAGGGGTSALSFNTDIWPIFNGKCGPCHVTAGYGNQNIGSDDKAQALSDAKDFKDGIIADIEDGSMPLGTCGGPPGSADGCVSASDFQKIQDWFAAGAPE